MENNLNREILKIDNPEVIQEIFQGKTLEIIIELMENDLSKEQLLNRLDIYPVKLDYYLLKLKKLGIIECLQEDVVRQRINSTYRLKQNNIKMIVGENVDPLSKIEILQTINTYRGLLKNGFMAATENPDLPNKQASVVIQTNRENAQLFKKELSKLIERFIDLEIEGEEERYIFLPMYFPYQQRSEVNDSITEK